ncbi:MAG: hypothetical protein DVB23_001365 [Verrucomicrobia bacterium]|nr:MAG: hypothetical protein DVB23_001365 [Verrucomicrobiota bacterium]
MSHPGDKPVQRFVAYLVGFGAMLAFGVLAPVASITGSLIWPRRSAVDELGVQRAESSLKLRAEQAVALKSVGTDAATKTTRVPVDFVAKTVLGQLKGKAPAASALVVPGSAAALRAMQQPAPAAKPAAPAPAQPQTVPAPVPPAPAPAPAAVPQPQPSPGAGAPKP